MEHSNSQNEWPQLPSGSSHGQGMNVGFGMRGVGRGAGRGLVNVQSQAQPGFTHSVPPQSQIPQVQSGPKLSVPQESQNVSAEISTQQESVQPPPQSVYVGGAPRFIPPTNCPQIPSVTKPPRTTVPCDPRPKTQEKKGKKQKKGSELVWTQDTFARPAPEDSIDPFILQQRALREQAERLEERKQQKFRPVDDEDDDWGNEFFDDDPSERSVLGQVRAERERRKEEMFMQQQDELISECIDLNPGMPVEWIQRVMSIEREGEREDIVFPRHDEVKGSSVPIGSLQVCYFVVVDVVLQQVIQYNTTSA